MDAELTKKALGDEAPVTCRFADTLQDAFEETKASLGDKAKTDEDVLSYIAFPQVYEKFVKTREEKLENRAKYTIEAM